MKITIKAGLCAGSLALLAAAPPAMADHKPVEEIIVNSSQEQSETILETTITLSPDSSEQLLRAPGMALNKNGPLTSLPQFRGMSGDRLAITLDGAPVTSAGPNLMDPPLSYTSAHMIEAITVHRGVAPVSVSLNSIGGAVEVKQWKPAFSDGKLRFGGDIGLGYSSVDESSQADLRAYLASSQQRLLLLASRVEGEDAEFPDGEITPTSYERQQYQLGYGFRTGRHQLDASWLVNRTEDAGTPALPMDIQSIDADIWRLNYHWAGDRYQLRARLYGNDTEHGMTNYQLRTAPANGMNWRRNSATSEGWGGNIELEVSQASGALVMGVDYRDEQHDSRIDNPNMAAFFVANFNDVESETSSLFVEKDLQLSDQVFGQLGARISRIENSAGDVNATPAMMMPPAGMLRDNFNASNNGRTDNTTDVVAKLSYRHSEQTTLYLGLAHKQRVPGYQELYLWLPLESTGGLADGNLYTGDPDLEVETNREVELGVDWTGRSLTLSPRVFYREVDDYVQGEPGTVAPAIMFTAMMRPDGNPPLRFSNIDASFWGADVALSYKISDEWQVNAVANYVRAETDDDQPLYRISPLNGYATLQWQQEDRGALLRIRGFAEQDRVSDTHFEQATAGGGIVDLSGHKQVTEKVRLTLGVDNLADKHYRQHLGGYNRAANADIGLMERLPGYGRSGYLRLDAQF
jgi:iron complex outermembrane receptor protein